MLRELHIRNFALLEDARLQLREGFNCLTGETGVGKSLVLGALDLLLGGRPRPDLVRKGADSLCVQGLFHAASPRILADVADAVGFPLEDGVCDILLEREYHPSGRNRCRVNGKPVSVAALRGTGERLVDIHGQQEHESLLHRANQRALLDSFAGLDTLRDRFAREYARLRDLRRRFDDLRQGEELRSQRLELLRFQLNEVEALAPESGEYQNLRRDHALLANAERIQQAVAAAVDALYEMDDSASDLVQRVLRELEPLAESDPDLAQGASALGEAAAQIEEAAFAVRRFRERFEFDPERLEHVGQRLASYERIARRHGLAPEQVADLPARLRADVDRIEAEARDLAGIEQAIADAEKSLFDIGSDLGRRRKAAAEALAARVQREMRDLAMPAASFRADVSSPADPAQALAAAGPSGFNEVEFLISTNPGEDPRPLRLVGSGGEIARVMLAVKGCLAEVDRTPVFVFDEIDSNVGGRLGAVIGRKIAAIARRHQVVCITHLPQIAAYADVQVKVQKIVRDGRTVSVLTELAEDKRIDELAEMIRGHQRTETTLQQAREMLESAQTDKSRPAPRRRGARSAP